MTPKTPKFCWGCGASLKENQKFCTRCGKPVKKPTPPETTSAPNVKKEDNTEFYNSTSNPKKNDYISSYSSIKNQHTDKYEPAGQQSTPKIPQPPITQGSLGMAQASAFSKEDLREIHELKEMMQNLNLEKRFKSMEYKINALNVENEILDLENKIDNYQLEMKESEPVKIPDNLATKEDLKDIQEKINTIDLHKLDDLEKLNQLGKIDQLEQRLRSLDSKMDSLDSAEKLSNLAQNTVTRLNQIEKRVNEFNLETRKRLSKMDERIEEMGGKMEHVNHAVDTILPALLKLTEKINDLNKQTKIAQMKANKHTVTEHAKPVSQDLDLPPFPSVDPKPEKKEKPKPEPEM